MRFTINRNEFNKALNIANKAVTKSSKAELNDLKLSLEDKGLVITGSNYITTIQTIVPFIINEQEIIRNYSEGQTLIVCDYLTSIIGKLDSEDISLEIIDNSICLISDGSNEYKLACGDVNEYPDIDLEPSGNLLTLSQKEFSTIINQTAFAAATKDTRKVLVAVNLVAENGILTAVATDGARLARKEISISPDLNFIANIPAKTLMDVNKLSEGLEEISIAINNEKALFTMGPIVFAASLCADPYPPTKNIVPREFNYSLEVNSNDFIKAIEKASILAVERENVVCLKIDETSLEISSKASIGSASSKLENFKFEGQHLEISFNNLYLLSAIKVLNSEDVKISFVAEMKPFVVTNNKDPSVVQVITPVRTY